MGPLGALWNRTEEADGEKSEENKMNGMQGNIYSNELNR